MTLEHLVPILLRKTIEGANETMTQANAQPRKRSVDGRFKGNASDKPKLSLKQIQKQRERDAQKIASR